MIYGYKPYRAKNMLIRELETNLGTGFLDISVFSEEDSSPIINAEVSIYLFTTRGLYKEAATENLIASYRTDEFGKIPIIELPVIHEFGNESENVDEYHMKVEALGYYTSIVVNMEIFPNTTTTFNVMLNPFTTGEPYTEYIIIPEKHF